MNLQLVKFFLQVTNQRFGRSRLGDFLCGHGRMFLKKHEHQIGRRLLCRSYMQVYCMAHVLEFYRYAGHSHGSLRLARAKNGRAELNSEHGMHHTKQV